MMPVPMRTEAISKMRALNSFSGVARTSFGMNVSNILSNRRDLFLKKMSSIPAKIKLELFWRDARPQIISQIGDQASLSAADREKFLVVRRVLMITVPIHNAMEVNISVWTNVFRIIMDPVEQAPVAKP